MPLLFPNRPHWDDDGTFIPAPGGPEICTCPPIAASNLCVQCLSLNLRHLIFCSPERKQEDLGRLDAMLARPECDFCSLVALGCRQLWQGEWTGITETKCSLNSVDISRQLKNGYALQITAWHKNRSFQWMEFEVVIRPEGESSPVERKLEKHPNVHLEKMRTILADCEQNHEECKVTLNTLDEMMVIDIENLNIVDAPTECRYCALSYVWGKSSKRWLTLTKDNAASLRAPNSLVGGSLSQTILDAIQVCKELGECYLWVDSLCIVQDDPVNQMRQIDIMDMIYASATVTLVAAAGDHADTGLPGVSVWAREATRQTITIQDMEVSNALPRLKDMIEVSVWNTRGWTYQERMFSHRCICFTESQAYYGCSQGVQYEEADRLARTIWTTESFKKKLQSGTFMELYTNNVTDYTLRSLTSQADIIRAFRGVLNDMSRKYTETFHAGLPAGQFEQALMWQKSRQSRAGDRSQIAPSWSWASAGSPIKYTIPEVGIHVSPTPLPAYWPDGEEPSQISTTWFLNTDGRLVTLKSDTHRDNLSQSSLSLSPATPPNELQSLALQESGRLLFSAQHVYMNLRNSVPYKTKDTWWTDYVADIDLSQISILSIILPGTESDNLAGFIEMEKPWAETSLDNPQGEWEFLAISLTTSKSDDFMHYHLMQQRGLNVPVVWRRNVRQLVMHVMLVERNEGVARRLGVGKIFLDMWERAAPETSWIVLG